MMRKIALTILVFVLQITFIESSIARDTIKIVGSSAVYPFSKAVARRYHQITQDNEPIISASNSTAGFEAFCAGSGLEYPDIANSSRRMESAELSACRKNGVKGVTELLIGYDGISLSTSKLVEKYNFSIKDLYLGLAKWVPNKEGQFVRNPHKKWSDINPDLPDIDIKFFGLPASSGTFDIFSELVLERGALEFSFLKKLNRFKSREAKRIQYAIEKHGIPQRYWEELVAEKGDKAKGKDLVMNLSRDIRDDNVYFESASQGEIINELVSNPHAVGIVSHGLMVENSMRVHASTINTVEATSENISKGDYPLSRGLYFYVKKSHIELLPGIRGFMKVFLSRVEMGEGGYLETAGLIVVDKETYLAVKKASKELLNLSCTRLMALHPFI